MNEKFFFHDALEQTLLSGEDLRKKVLAQAQTGSPVIALSTAKKAPRRRLSSRMAIALAAAAILLLSGTALAVGLVLTGGGSKIGFFSDTNDPELKAQQGYYERASDAVDQPLTSSVEGDTLTINNIAINRDRVTVFYTATSAAPLPNDAAAPAPWLSLDDGTRQQSLVKNVLAERADEWTLSCMQSFSLTEALPKTCTLTIGFDALFGQTGDWQHTFQVDLTQSSASTIAAYPNAVIRLVGTGDVDRAPYFSHDVTIAAVMMDQTGGVLLLEEETPGDALYRDDTYRAWADGVTAAKAAYLATSPGKTEMDWEAQNGPLDEYLAVHPCPYSNEEILAILNASSDSGLPSFLPFVSFAVFNDRGESLNPRCVGITGSSLSRTAQNKLYFTPDYETAYIRLVPILGSKGARSVNMMFDALNTPVAVYDGLTITLLDVQVDAAKRTITTSYREDGITAEDRYSKSRVLSASGTVLENCGSIVSSDAPFRDDTTGVYTETLTFLDNAFDVTSIRGIEFRYDEPALDEANAITIRLG